MVVAVFGSLFIFKYVYINVKAHKSRKRLWALMSVRKDTNVGQTQRGEPVNYLVYYLPLHSTCFCPSLLPYKYFPLHFKNQTTTTATTNTTISATRTSIT